MKRFTILVLIPIFFGCIPESNTDYDLLHPYPLKTGTKKTLLCHNARTISVNENAIQAHLNHGDLLGECLARTFVPDDNFEQYLIDSGYDDVLDDYVLTTNINTVEELELEFNLNSTVDLTGIEDFKELKDLIIWHATILPFDIASLQNLVSLSFFENARYEGNLNIENMDNMKSLLFLQSSLESLTVKNNPVLYDIQYYETIVPYIEFANNPNLTIYDSFDSGGSTFIFTNNDAITDLTLVGSGPNIGVITNNANLKSIYFEEVRPNSEINSLDLEGNPSLTQLVIIYGQLSTINLTNLSTLTTLHLIEGQLEAIDISGLPNLTNFNISSNPLTCIKANQNQLENIPEGWIKDPEDSYALDCP